MASKRLKVKKVPNLRFPEFEGKWNREKVGSILTIGSGKDYKHLSKGTIPVFGTGGYMTSVDDFLYEGESVCIGRKGTINKPLYFNGKFWTVDTLFYTHSFKSVLPKFVYNIFEQINWLKYNEASGVPSLSKSTIEQIDINIPCIEEQLKIATFLSLIDERIHTQNKIIKELSVFKNSISKKIFSQELRFKDKSSNEFPRWEFKEIGDVFTITRGNVLSMSLLSNDKNKENNYPVYSSQTKNKGLAGYYNNFIFENAITWTTDGANAGDVNYREGKFYCTNVCGVLLNSNGNTNPCIAELINSVSHKYVSYVGNPKLMNGTMSSITIPFPSIQEQQKISNILISLNTKIDIENTFLQKLENQKKYLLQQMFI